jgi:DNA polymerase-3 subunit gamma/tau
MAYTVLARRYRSATFDDVIGQDHVAQTLKKAIDSGRVAHAYLFCGTRGVGKTSMARILAKALNCEAHSQPTSSPCGKCNACLAIARGDDLDVIEIDAASNRGIDNIRDLISNAQFHPARSRFKIYIIDEVHGLSKDAFNALLKVLEEPPEHVKFILATTEPEKVLATILSRCQRYDFRNIGTREIARHLADICKKEKIKGDEDALMLIGKAGAGSMRDALSLLDRMLSAAESHLTIELVERLLGMPRSQLMFDLAGAIGGGDVKSVLGQVNSLVGSGLSVDSLLGALVDHLRNLLIILTCGNDSELVEAPGLSPKDLAAQAAKFDAAALTQDISILEELRRQIRQSQAGRALLDAAMVRLTLADQFSSIGDLLSRLDGNEPGETQKKNDRPPRPIDRPVTPATEVAEPRDVPSPPINDLPGIWQAALARLADQGPSLQSLLGPGKLTSIQNDSAVVCFAAQHETFVRRLDRNGKKELVREALSQVLGRPIGVRFDLEPEAAAPPATEEPAKGKLVSAAPVETSIVSPAPARITPEMSDEIRRSEPLVRALMETLGATIVKVE